MSKVLASDLKAQESKFPGKHNPKEECGLNEEPEEISSKFHREFLKNAGYATIEETLKSTAPVKDGNYTKLTYTVSNLFEYIESLDIRGTLPEVKVKDKYKDKVRIMWSENASVKNIIKVTMQIGEVPYFDFDSDWIIDTQKWNTVPGGKECMERSIGNMKDSLFTSHIEEINYKFPLPVCYSFGDSSSLPLFCITDVVTHDMYYVDNIVEKLLNVEVLRDGKWVPDTPRDAFLEYNLNREHPQLTGKYTKIKNFEMLAIKEEESFIIPMHNVKTITKETFAELGSVCKLAINTDEEVLALFWKANNTTVGENKCNNTTHLTDSKKGKFPILTTILNNKESERFKVDSKDCNTYSMLKNFTSVPEDKGYHAYAFSNKPFNTSGAVGVVLDDSMGSVLTCMFTGNFKNDTKNKEEEEDIDALFGKSGKKELTKNIEIVHETEDIIKTPTTKMKYQLSVRVLTTVDLEFKNGTVKLHSD